MSDLTIITNNVPRDIVEAWELTEKERVEFDYLDWAAIADGRDSASFFRYKGELYDLGDCEPIEPIRAATSPNFSAWDGIYTQGYFSGVVFKYVEEFEKVIVGRYYS